MTKVNALVKDGHSVVFTDDEGLEQRKDGGNTVVLTRAQYDEFAAFGSVKEAPKDPLDHDNNGTKGGFAHQTVVGVEPKRVAGGKWIVVRGDVTVSPADESFDTRDAAMAWIAQNPGPVA